MSTQSNIDGKEDLLVCRSPSIRETSLDRVSVHASKTLFGMMPASRHFPKLINKVSGREYPEDKPIWDDLRPYFEVQVSKKMVSGFVLSFLVPQDMATEECLEALYSDNIFNDSRAGELHITDDTDDRPFDPVEQFIPGQIFHIL